MVGPESMDQVYGKLMNELNIFYGKFNAESGFTPPPGMTDGHIIPQQQQQTSGLGQSASAQVVVGVGGDVMGGIEGQQRGGRATIPNNNGTSIKLKSLLGPAPNEKNRHLGDGIPQF